MADDDRFRIVYFMGRKPLLSVRSFDDLGDAMVYSDELMASTAVVRVQIWPSTLSEGRSALLKRAMEDEAQDG